MYFSSTLNEITKIILFKFEHCQANFDTFFVFEQFLSQGQNRKSLSF